MSTYYANLKTTYFFSNTAGEAINKKALEYWRDGLKRENILYKDLEELIVLSAYNEKGEVTLYFYL